MKIIMVMMMREKLVASPTFRQQPSAIFHGRKSLEFTVKYASPQLRDGTVFNHLSLEWRSGE